MSLIKIILLFIILGLFTDLVIRCLAHKILNHKASFSHEFRHFSILNYVSILWVPYWGVLGVALVEGVKVIQLVIIWMFFGTFVEWLIGFAWHKVMGRRLWVYKRWAIGGYTSLLSAPTWGLGGAVITIFTRLFNLT